MRGGDFFPRSAPAGVEYRLTSLGEILLGPVAVLAQWAEEHASELVC